uniref:Secreted protein n=1 Tax=Echinococcus granulosus TaxID=6210 RepID=A0A068X0E0_ECHGR|nr:hypothetical protein EgrG_002041100 [Echinococcus granulosus]
MCVSLPRRTGAVCVPLIAIIITISTTTTGLPPPIGALRLGVVRQTGTQRMHAQCTRTHVSNAHTHAVRMERLGVIASSGGLARTHAHPITSQMGWRSCSKWTVCPVHFFPSTHLLSPAGVLTSPMA